MGSKTKLHKPMKIRDLTLLVKCRAFWRWPIGVHVHVEGSKGASCCLGVMVCEFRNWDAKLFDQSVGRCMEAKEFRVEVTRRGPEYSAWTSVSLLFLDG